MKMTKLILTLCSATFLSIASANVDETKIQDIQSSGSQLAPMPMSTEMNLRGRFDWTHLENKTAAGTSKDSEIETKYFRIIADGKVTSSTKFSFVLKPLETAANNAMVDSAIVTKKLNDNFSLLIGIQSPMIGGRENDYADYDLFLTSLFKNSLPSSTPGVSTQFEFKGQSFYFQALKAPVSSATLKSVYTYGVSYYGNLWDEKIVPIFSYHQEATDRSRAKNKYLAFGAQAVSGNAVVEFDWLKKSEERNGIDNKNKDTTSMVFNLRYTYERFKPFAKLILDKTENINGAVTKTERTGYEAGIFFQPAKEEDMHYHLVYNSAETKEKVGGTATSTESKVVIGATFNFNILK